MFLHDYVFSTFYRILSFIHFSFLNYIGNTSCIMHFFGNLTTCSCVIGILVIWFIIHSLYFKCIKALLKRMSFSEVDRNRLTEAAWSAGFSFGIIPLSVAKLHSVVYSIKVDTNDFNFKEFLSYEDISIPDHVTFCFVIMCSYLVHQILFCLSRQGFEMECIMQISFCIFFICSYAMRHFQLGLIVLIFLSIPNFIAELTRMFYIVHHKQNSVIVYLTLFSCYSVCWIVLSLTLLPKLVLCPLVFVEVLPEHSRTMNVLIFAVWSFYVLHLYMAPISKLIRNYIFSSKKDVSLQIERALFSAPRDHKEIINVLFRVRNNINKRYSITSDKSQMNSRRSSHGKTLYQTFRCMMTLRRKLRQNRLRKEQLTLSKEQSVIEKLLPKLN